MVFFCILVLSLDVWAQGENNTWAFGSQTGIDFSTGTAVPIQTSIEQLEGCATVSDESGKLLLYSDGNTIYNSNHVPMPNGVNIAAWNRTVPNLPTTTYSTTQPCVIIPVPGQGNKYYVFSLDAGETYQGRLYYSMVDMNLSGGLGDVIPGKKGIPLDTCLHEKMTAVAGCNNNIWLVVHNELDGPYFRNHYKSYEITTLGLDTVPVISKIPTSYGHRDPNYIDYGGSNHYVYLVGTIKFSHDRTKMAAALFPWLRMEPTVIELYDFDACTGIISNPVAVAVDTFYSDTVGQRYYGVCFSPDDSKLYATCIYSGVYQWDLDQPLPSVGNTKTLVYDRPMTAAHYLGDLRDGPDGQIYIACYNDSFLHVIRNPNNPGAACNFAEHGFPLLPGTRSMYGLPNNTVVPYNRMDTVSFSSMDTIICREVALSGRDSFCRYSWNTGAVTKSMTIDRGGIYWVASQQECSIYIDTFNVTFVKGLNLGSDTTICPGDSIVLKVSGDEFEWQDGSTGDYYKVTRPGLYYVTINDKGCYNSDSISVDLYTAKAEILENDTLICKGQMIFLHGLSEPGGNLRWNTGSEEASLQITESGHYILEATNLCGVFYDSVTVQVQDCDCQPGIPNAFSPNNDGVNDVFKVVLRCNSRSFTLSVYNRFGERIYSGSDQDKGWDGTYQGQYVDIGVYFYDLKYETPNGAVIRKKGDVVLIR
jgi:gliding motility-associated-like protein